MKKSSIFGLTFSLLLFSFTIWLYLNSQNVVDWWKLRGYEPAPEISRLADDASFSEEGRRLFYIHDPSLLDKNEFQQSCTNTEITIVLGCYIANDKIYIFDVDDERLSGVEEVTAAHEMLHAVYDRLSDDEIDQLKPALIEVLETTENDRIRANIENYRDRDPALVVIELHSIVGTEVREIPQILEDHYSEYFDDRLQVVELAEAYEAEFTKIQDQITEYDEELDILLKEIQQLQSDVETIGSQLQNSLLLLNSLKDNPSAYNAQVPSYNRTVREYNTTIDILQSKIDQYNEIVEKRNALAVEEKELVDAIDTRVQKSIE